MILVGPHVQAALRSAQLRGVLLQDPEHYAGGSAISGAELARATQTHQ
jgi:hypothetical protein